MQSVITSKYQTTVPKAVREHLGLGVKDTIEWKLEEGKIVIYPAKRIFLKYRNSVRLGRGRIVEDIEAARSLRLEKYG